jgi:hypothetical protein
MPPILNKPPLVSDVMTYEIKDGILYMERLERANYKIENVKMNVEIRNKYTGGVAYPSIVYGKDILSMDKSAREYLAGAGSENILSRAFVIEKSQGKLALHFFMGTNKQPIPTKIFDDLEEAIEWSKQFRQKR